MKKIVSLQLIALLALILILGFGCGKYEPEWLVVTGTGAPNPGKPPSQGKLMAKRAAEMDARRNMLEQIKGVPIDSTTYVKDFMTQSDSIRSQIDGMIKGAQVIATRFNDDGTVEVDLQIDLKKVKKLVK